MGSRDRAVASGPWHGATVHALTDFSDTPIQLVSYGADKHQRTSLHVASYNGKLEIARLLLDRSAKVDAVDDFGQDFGENPLHDVSQGK